MRRMESCLLNRSRNGRPGDEIGLSRQVAVATTSACGALADSPETSTGKPFKVVAVALADEIRRVPPGALRAHLCGALPLRAARKESGGGKMRLRLCVCTNCRDDDGIETVRDREPVNCSARLERVFFGTRSADYIRASGHTGCIRGAMAETIPQCDVFPHRDVWFGRTGWVCARPRFRNKFSSAQGPADPPPAGA